MRSFTIADSTRLWPNVDLMMAQRLGYCPNIKWTSGQRVYVFWNMKLLTADAALLIVRVF